MSIFSNRKKSTIGLPVATVASKVNSTPGRPELPKTTSDLPQYNRRGVLGTASLGITAAAGVALLIQSGNNTAHASSSTGTYNVRDYGAAGNGSTDDTGAIQSTISTASGGGIVLLPSGTYKIVSPLVISNPNIILQGVGASSIIQPSASFSGSAIVSIIAGANSCSVRDLQIAYAATTSSQNPDANGIEVTGATSALLTNLEMKYINGYAIESIATNAKNNAGCTVDHVHIWHCTGGIHIQSNGSVNNVGQHYLSNIYPEIVDSEDALFLEDVNDILCANYNGAVAGGTSTGSMLHIRGASHSIYFSNVDLGCINAANAPIILIDSVSNDVPSEISIIGGIVQTGTAGIEIDAGKLITICDLVIQKCVTYGLNITGSVSSTTIARNRFISNGTTAGSARYDAQSSTTGQVDFVDNIFLSAIGSGPNQVNFSMNVTAGYVQVLNGGFWGSYHTSSSAFNNLPAVVRNVHGYNPLGSLATPAMPASGVNKANPFPVDCTVFIHGGIVTAISIGGTTTGLTSGSFRVPVGQTIAITYSSAPSWTWFGD
jgi:hypothetical protein